RTSASAAARRRRRRRMAAVANECVVVGRLALPRASTVVSPFKASRGMGGRLRRRAGAGPRSVNFLAPSSLCSDCSLACAFGGETDVEHGNGPITHDRSPLARGKIDDAGKLARSAPGGELSDHGHAGATSVGVECGVVVPSPSSPIGFAPQQRSWLSFVSAHVCWYPAEKLATLEYASVGGSPPSSTGGRASC